MAAGAGDDDLEVGVGQGHVARLEETDVEPDRIVVPALELHDRARPAGGGRVGGL